MYRLLIIFILLPLLSCSLNDGDNTIKANEYKYLNVEAIYNVPYAFTSATYIEFTKFTNQNKIDLSHKKVIYLSQYSLLLVITDDTPNDLILEY